MKLTGMISSYMQIHGDMEEEKTYLLSFDSRTYPFYEFRDQVLNAENEFERDEHTLSLLCLVGSKAKIEEASQQLKRVSQDHLNVIVERDLVHLEDYLNDLEPSTLEELSMLSLILALENNRGVPSSVIVELNDAVSGLVIAGSEEFERNNNLITDGLIIWNRLDSPILFGKQLMTTSFLMKSLRKRRLLGSIPSPETGEWYLLFEGGVKVYLNDELPYRGDTINIRDINRFTTNQIDEIINNPIYTHGKWYYPTEVMLEWQNVFLYALASLDIQYDVQTLESIYEDFLNFLEINICNVTDAEPMFEKEKYFELLLRLIESRRQYLRCRVEAGVSKNLMFLMESRYFYLQDLYPIVAKYYPEEVEKRLENIPFQIEEWKNLLESLDQDTDNEKGKAMERLGEYFLSTISGLKLTGRRIREAKEEIDLCFMNVSLDYDLWKMGPLLLVECKNRKEKLSVSVLRSLIQVMEAKGGFTLILFTKSGLTKTAKQEVRDQALYGKYIIDFNLTELKRIDENHLPSEVLSQKLDLLLESVSDDIGMLS